MLKQRVFHKQLPDVLNALKLPMPPLMGTIVNENSRSSLRNQYERIIQQTKSDLMMVHIAAAEAKMREYQAEFDRTMYRMEQGQHEPLSDRRLSSMMIDIMYRRFKLIDERTKHLYNLKVNFFVKAPTVIA